MQEEHIIIDVVSLDCRGNHHLAKDLAKNGIEYYTQWYEIREEDDGRISAYVSIIFKSKIDLNLYRTLYDGCTNVYEHYLVEGSFTFRVEKDK